MVPLTTRRKWDISMRCETWSADGSLLGDSCFNHSGRRERRVARGEGFTAAWKVLVTVVPSWFAVAVAKNAYFVPKSETNIERVRHA